MITIILYNLFITNIQSVVLPSRPSAIRRSLYSDVDVVPALLGTQLYLTPLSSVNQSVFMSDELRCNLLDPCCWSNVESPQDDIDWLVGTTNLTRNLKAQKLFRSTQLPEAPYLITAAANSTSLIYGVLRSCMIRCQSSSGVLTFKLQYSTLLCNIYIYTTFSKWTSSGVSLDVCILPQWSKKYSYCQTVNSNHNPVVANLPASYVPFQITVTASEFVQPPGGIAIINGISYKATMCIATTTARTTQKLQTQASKPSFCGAIQCNKNSCPYRNAGEISLTLTEVKYKFLDDCASTVYRICLNNEKQCSNSVTTSGRSGQWIESSFDVPKGTQMTSTRIFPMTSNNRDRIKQFLDSNAQESDCTPKCRSKIHRHLCRRAIFNKNCSEEHLAAYLLYACQNFYKNCAEKFQNGDNILHWICSSETSKPNLLAWVLENFGSQDEILNARDFESGYTPLHKSILYGNIACSQILLKHGAATNVRDFDGLTAIDLLNANTKFEISEKNTVNLLYGFGENVSYNLGHSLPTRKSQFDLIDFPSSSPIKRLCMSNYHTVFLTQNGQLWTCGQGACGRLGLGDGENSAQILPKLVDTVVLSSNPEHQSQTMMSSSKIQFSRLAVSNNHSLAVTVDGDAYSWGDNSHRSLGHSPNPNDKELRPRLIHFPKNFKNTCQFVGCGVSNVSSVLWSQDSIYTFGENAGHLGHAKQDGQFLHFPKKVIMSTIRSIDHVAMTNNAMAVVAGKGEVFLFQNFDCKKIVNRMLDLKTVCLIPEDCSSSTKLLILTTTGKLFFWQTNDAQPIRMVFLGVPRMIYPIHIAVADDSLHLVAPNGDFFSGDFTKMQKNDPPNAVAVSPGTDDEEDGDDNDEDLNIYVTGGKPHDQVARHHVKNTKNQQLKLEHENSYKESLKSIVKPKTNPSSFQCQKPNLLDYSQCVRLPLRRQPNIFRAQWSSCSPDGRNILVYVQQSKAHIPQILEQNDICILNDFRKFYEDIDEENADLILECESVKFPVHKFVLASRSGYFAEALKSNPKLNHIRAPEGISPNILGQALRSIYFWELKSQAQLKTSTSKAAQKLKAEVASSVNNALKTLRVENFDNGFKFHADQWPELFDITLVCIDGRELPCHRSVLCARVDYFRCMFASHWMEASVNQAKFKINAEYHVAKILLQYIYQDSLDEIFADIDEFNSNDDNELLNLLCKLLVAADEWLLDGLRRLCEMELCKLVSLKNCLELLQMAQTYNAENLHKCCRIFICLNLCSLLTNGQFLNLDNQVVRRLEGTYKLRGCNTVCPPIKTFDNRTIEEAVEIAFVTLKSCDIDDDLDLLCQEYVRRTANAVDQSDASKSTKKLNIDSTSKKQHERLPDESPVSSFKESGISTMVPDEHNINKSNKCHLSLQSPDFDDEKPVLSIAEKSKAKRIARWFEPSSPSSDANFSMVSLRDVMDLEEKAQLAAETKRREMVKKATPPATTTPTSKKGWNIQQSNSVDQSPLAESSPFKIFRNDVKSQPIAISSSPQKSPATWTPTTTAAEHASTSFLAVSPSFREIVLDEETSLIHRREILNKPLKFIQMEEQALQELRLAYEADNNFDENITVERFFEGRVAEPHWQAHVAESL